MVRIIILFSFSFFLFSESAFPTKSESQSTRQEQWHTLPIGFNLSYPDRVPMQEFGLRKIADLGIKHVRISEIFDNNGGTAYQQRLKRALDVFVKYGMLPMLSISNAPAELIPDAHERKSLEQSLPTSVVTKIPKVLKYSNRFPPRNLEQYREKIQELIDFLFKIYGKKQVVRWWFEIGNEPDAFFYYWGTLNQFKTSSRAAIEVLRKNGIHHVGGYGMTHRAVFPSESNESRKHTYAQLMQDIITLADHDGFISFHLYERKSPEAQAEPLRGLPEWIGSGRKQVMITEWNVSSQGGKASIVFNKQGAWGRKFIQLLVDSYRNKLARIYIFKLMDYPIFRGPQLGAFNLNGKPKKWFHEFTSIWRVIRGGYSVQLLPYGGVSIQNRSGASIRVAGTKAIDINMDFYRLIYPASEAHIRQAITVPPGEWVVLDPVEAE